MKNATDMELAGLDSLKAYAVTIKHDGKLDERQEAHIQAALLYTTADGKRRVRVHNLALACTTQLSMVYRGISLDTTNLIFARMMIQQSISVPLSNVRGDLSNKCIKILVAYRDKVATASSAGQLILPESFKLCAIFALSLLKMRAFRKRASPDLRVYSMRLINSIGVSELSVYLYPYLYDCSELLDVSKEEIGIGLMYPTIRASAMRIQSDRIYLAGILGFT
jgi:protein transport protein SEC24